MPPAGKAAAFAIPILSMLRKGSAKAVAQF
jgi:hypothetical protein